MAKDNIEPLNDTPSGEHRRWKMELKAADRDVLKWHERAKKVIRRYIDERDDSEQNDKRLNLFYSDTQIKMALLFGKVPKVDASRRFLDANDDPARVAGEVLDRMLNTDIEKGSDSYASTLEHALEDWLIPGLGQGKIRYRAEFETVQETPEVPGTPDPMTGELRGGAPLVPEHQKKSYECVEIDYVHWKDFRWSPCKTWEQARWVAFGTPMTREQCVEAFGEDLGKAVPLDAKRDDQSVSDAEEDPGARAYVWEVWSKDDKAVYWLSEGYPAILKKRQDPLGLENFFPCPRPLVANPTTSHFRPTPDWYIAQALYAGCDELFRRMCVLEEAICVRGVYNKAVPELAELLNSRAENRMIPAENFARFADGGGLEGAVAFAPIEGTAGVLAILSQKLSEKIQLLYQVTGMSDIMRGAAQQSATATEQAIKAKFGSVRSQKKQDEFARFASDLLKLKGEVISLHFDPETIANESNIMQTPDAPLAQAAIQLIKDKFSCYRIEVRPEQISMPDLAQLKQEKTEWMGAVSGMFQQIMQAAQVAPPLVPMMLQLMQWALTGFKGAAQAEGIVDQGVAAFEQMLQQKAQQPPQPDPRMMAQQAKAQGDMQREQTKLQADLVRTQAETQSEIKRQQGEAFFNVKEAEGVERAKALAQMGIDPRAGGAA